MLRAIGTGLAATATLIVGVAVPEVLPTDPDARQYVVWLLLVVAGALYILSAWLFAHEKGWWRGFLRWLPRNVWWRFRLRPPVCPRCHGQSVQSEPASTPEPTAPQASPAPVLRKPPPSVPEQEPTLSDQERGPCRNAIDRVHEFIENEVAAFHHSLAAASGEEAKARRLAKSMHEPLQTRDRLQNRALNLSSAHNAALTRLGVKFRPLREALNAIKEPMTNFRAAQDFTPAALQESAAVLVKANERLGEIAARIDGALLAKRKEHFGE